MNEYLRGVVADLRLEGFSYREIHERLGIPYNSIKAAMNKNRKKEDSDRIEKIENVSGQQFTADYAGKTMFNLCSDDYIVEYPYDVGDISDVIASVDRLRNASEDERIRIVVMDEGLISERMRELCDGILIETEQNLDKGEWVW